MKDQKLIPIAEIIDRGMLPCSKRVLRRLIAAGKIKAVNIGAGDTIPRWAVAEAELARFKNE